MINDEGFWKTLQLRIEEQVDHMLNYKAEEINQRLARYGSSEDSRTEYLEKWKTEMRPQYLKEAENSLTNALVRLAMEDLS